MKLQKAEVLSQIKTIQNSVQDVDKIRHLEHFRNILVHSTLTNWRKKVKYATAVQALEYDAKQQEHIKENMDTQHLIDEYSKWTQELKQQRKIIEGLRMLFMQCRQESVAQELLDAKRKEFAIIEIMTMFMLL